MPWFYAEGTQQTAERRGPLDDATFEAMAHSGRLRASTLVWQTGMAEWQPLSVARPDLALTPPSLSEAPPPVAFCSMCGVPHPPEDLIGFSGRQICAACKPRFAQALTLGLDLSLPRPRYAGFWIRFGARLIDGMLIFIVQLSLTLSVTALAGQNAILSAIMLILSVVGPVVYEVAMTIKYRATLGKLALGIRILRADGSPLTWSRVLGRHFAQLLSATILLIGYLMVAFDPRKQALHDRLCDTVVVYEH